MKTFKEFNSDSEINEKTAKEAIEATTLIINKDDFDKAVKLLAKAGIRFGYKMEQK